MVPSYTGRCISRRDRSCRDRPSDALHQSCHCTRAATALQLPPSGIRESWPVVRPTGHLRVGVRWTVGARLCRKPNDDRDSRAVEGTGPLQRVGTTRLLRPDSAPVPTAFVALTEKAYPVPTLRPLIVDDVASAVAATLLT